MRTEPYTVGEEVKLRSYGRGDKVYITTPSNVEIWAPMPTGTYVLVLSESGSWVVQWGNGDQEILTVLEPRETALELIEESPPPPKPTHPLSTI